MVLKNLCVLVLWTKIAFAWEGLITLRQQSAQLPFTTSPGSQRDSVQLVTFVFAETMQSSLRACSSLNVYAGISPTQQMKSQPTILNTMPAL